MPGRKVVEFLDGHQVKFVTVRHSKAYTAQEIAATAHIPGKELAKTVIVRIDGQLAMAVVPASHRIDFDRLRAFAGADAVELATEQDFRDLFPECEIGAMPPFGNLYGMEVFVARPLNEDEEIAFNAGSHTELIRLSYTDYQRLVDPKVGDFADQD